MFRTGLGYYETLRDNPDFRKLFLGEVVSFLGDWFNYIAVQTLVFQLTRSGLATGLAIITSTLPAFFLTPLAGSIVDRYDRRKIMIAADLARTVLALGMILVRTVDQVPVIYLLMGLLVVFGSFFNPASVAAIPNLVRREQLFAANSLSNVMWGVMLAVGALTGGIAITLVGMDMAFVINSLSFLFSAAMLLLIRTPLAEARERRTTQLNPLADFREGLAYAWQRPQVTALLLVKAGGALAAGLILLLTIYSFEIFYAGAYGIGLLQTARGVGILLGPLLAAPLVRGRIGRGERVIAAGFLLAGVAYLAFGAAPTLSLAMIAVAIAHAGWGSNWSLSATLLQYLTPDQVRGRVFSMDIGLFTLTNALSTFVTGAAADRIDPRAVTFVLGTVFIAFGALWGGGVLLGRKLHPEHWHDGSMYGPPAFSLEPAAVVEAEAK